MPLLLFTGLLGIACVQCVLRVSSWGETKWWLCEGSCQCTTYAHSCSNNWATRSMLFLTFCGILNWCSAVDWSQGQVLFLVPRRVIWASCYRFESGSDPGQTQVRPRSDPGLTQIWQEHQAPDYPLVFAIGSASWSSQTIRPRTS